MRETGKACKTAGRRTMGPRTGTEPVHPGAQIDFRTY
jgi:hypothetical protein